MKSEETVEQFYNWLCKVGDDTTYKKKCAYHKGVMGDFMQYSAQEDVIERIVVRYSEVLLGRKP